MSHFHLAWEGAQILVLDGFGTVAHLGSDFRHERKIENREKLEDDSAPSFQDGGNDATCATSGLISLLHSHNMRKWKRNITKQTNKHKHIHGAKASGYS